MSATSRLRAWVLVVMCVWPTLVMAQGMDLRLAAGKPLPVTDLPAGTVSVRLVRESFANPLAGVPVAFDIDGVLQAVTTDAAGRAQVDGIRAGATVRAVATVGTERLESDPATIGTSGIRFVLVAGLAGVPAPAAPSVTAVPGIVTLGPDSRVVVEFANERLNVFYMVQVINAGTAPVDLGGPLVFELPSSARSTTVLEGSTPNAKANGSRVIVTGPFAPGMTDVRIAYDLPYSGDTAHLQQSWPADAAEFPMFALKIGDLDVASPHISRKQEVVQQGQRLVVGMTPALAKGQPFEMTITGLPSHATWPRNVALGAAGTIVLVGLWAAFGPGARRRAA